MPCAARDCCACSLSCVSDELAALLVKDVRKKFAEWSDEFGRRGVDQMVGFLAACAFSPEPLGRHCCVWMRG